MSLEVKLDSNFIVCLARIKSRAPVPTQIAIEIVFRYISVHCEIDSSIHFCTLRHVVNCL